jgi:GNAT superfamily N-acetyltransferase
MTKMERAGDTAIVGKVMPDADHAAVADDLRYMRLSYEMEYGARLDPWEWPEGYPQEWSVRAFIEPDEPEAEYDDKLMDARGRIAVADAQIYVIPDVGAIDFWNTLDAHDGETAHFAEAFMAAGSRSDRLSVDGEPIFEGDLMIVSSVHVEQRFRGHRVGQAVLKAILHAVGRGTVLTVLRAAPVLRGRKLREGSAAHRAESAALGRYWAELGFRPLWQDYMVLSYFDMLTMLAEDDEDDEDDDGDGIEDLGEDLRHVPLLQLSPEQRDAAFRELRASRD